MVTLKTDIDFEKLVKKALNNISKWGLQDKSTLILAMTEELGELSQAYLQNKHENGKYERIGKELDDLMALGIQLRLVLNNRKIEDPISATIKYKPG